MVKSLLSDADARAIEAAVQRVESRSSTELVVAVLPQSSDYVGVRLLVACGWALASAVATLHYSSWPAVWAILIEIPIAALVYLVLGSPALHRKLISRSVAEERVRRRAFALFAEHGVHQTRGRTGLLVLVSELEHQVIILGDSKIQELIGEVGFQQHVQKLIQRLRAGEGARGILELIEDFSPLLEQHAPRSADDVNELPDAVLRA